MFTVHMRASGVPAHLDTPLREPLASKAVRKPV